jgi:ketosteroid isomerase-like protein
MSQENVETARRAFEAWNAMRKAWDDYRGGAWERLTIRIQEIGDLGESVLVLGHIDLTARTTRIRFHEEVGSLMTFRDGKILRSEDHLSHAKALEAAGLSQ